MVPEQCDTVRPGGSRIVRVGKGAQLGYCRREFVKASQARDQLPYLPVESLAHLGSGLATAPQDHGVPAVEGNAQGIGGGSGADRAAVVQHRERGDWIAPRTVPVTAPMAA